MMLVGLDYRFYFSPFGYDNARLKIERFEQAVTTWSIGIMTATQFSF